MKRIVLPLLFGLLLGLGGGTGYVMFTGGGAPPEEADHSEETAAVDSTHAEEEASAEDTAAPAPAPGSSGLIRMDVARAPADSTAHRGAESTTAAAPDSTDVEHATTEPGSEAAETPTPTAEAADPAPTALPADGPARDEAAKRLAKIFGTMQARDAARVLGLLRQDEIERILRQLDARSAAKILASLDPELAAALSSTLIHEEGQ